MSFSDEQKAALSSNLDGRLVRTRKQAGQTLSYIEGWTVKALLNKHFGPDGWGHKVEDIQYRHWTDDKGRPQIEAVATVTLYVAGKLDVTTEVGGGNGIGRTAMQDAAKEAATDGLKRCAVSLGWSMGLALYDDTHRHIRRAG